MLNIAAASVPPADSPTTTTREVRARNASKTAVQSLSAAGKMHSGVRA